MLGGSVPFSAKVLGFSGSSAFFTAAFVVIFEIVTSVGTVVVVMFIEILDGNVLDNYFAVTTPKNRVRQTTCWLS